MFTRICWSTLPKAAAAASGVRIAEEEERKLSRFEASLDIVAVLRKKVVWFDVKYQDVVVRPVRLIVQGHQTKA
jgi:hypothetical protein